MTEREYKTMVIPCKVCAKEFEFRCPLKFYELAVEAAEGDLVEFTGTCPDCRKNDPFLTMLDEIGVPTLGHDYTRKL